MVLVREVYTTVGLFMGLFRFFGKIIRLQEEATVSRVTRRSAALESVFSLPLLYTGNTVSHSLWRMADYRYMVIMVDIATSLPGSWSHAAIAARSATPTAGLERRSRAARPTPASGGAFSCLRMMAQSAMVKPMKRNKSTTRKSNTRPAVQPHRHLITDFAIVS